MEWIAGGTAMMQHPHNHHKQLLVGLMGVQECLADQME